MKRGNSDIESGTYIEKHTKGKLYGGTGRIPDTSQGTHGATKSSERLEQGMLQRSQRTLILQTA